MNSSGRFWTWFWLAAIGVPLVAFVVWANVTNPRQFVSTLLNGVTLAALYFLVASGFTLVFGLMRNVNLAHGSLFLLGAYIGWVVGDAHRQLVPGHRRRLRLGRPGRLPAPGLGVPLHAGPGAAPDHGHDRHLDRAGRPHAVVLRRRDLFLRPAARDLPDHADGRGRQVSGLPPRGAGHRHRGRPGAVAVPQPDQGRHDDPRRSRRPPDAGGVRRQRAARVSPSPSRSAPAWPAWPASSAARRCRSRRARTRAT